MKEKIIEFIKVHRYRILLLIVMLLYTIISFYKLGNNYNPQTFVNLKNTETLTYEIEDNKRIKKIIFYTGPNDMYVSCYLANVLDSEEGWTKDIDCTADYANILKWNTYELNNTSGSTLLVAALSK